MLGLLQNIFLDAWLEQNIGDQVNAQPDLHLSAGDKHLFEGQFQTGDGVDLVGLHLHAPTEGSLDALEVDFSIFLQLLLKQVALEVRKALVD